MAVIIIGREIAVTGFRAIASSRGKNIPASGLGKLKMTLETVTLCLLILGPVNLGRLHLLAPVGLWLTVAVALASAVEYYVRFAPTILSKDV
jgi:CDP-diacylglycerol--glycerol-3-phosphate 3-phosphatidyltransferase